MDPHEREYAAAVDALHEQTPQLATRMIDGRPRFSAAVGDRIRFMERGKELHGIVVEVLTPTTSHVRRHVPDHGNVHHAVEEGQLLPW